MIPKHRPGLTTVERMPAGYATTEGTLKKLAEIVRDRHTHPRIRARMMMLLEDAPGPRPAFLEIVERVWDWICSSVRYVADPLGAEHITDPVTLDELIDQGKAMEDCESMALYAATLLASVGIPSMFDAMGRPVPGRRKFRHCALQVMDTKSPGGARMLSFDPVGVAEHGPEAFGLGDSLYRGGPRELWTLSGERAFTESDTGGMMDSAFGDVTLGATLEEKILTGTDIAKKVAAAIPFYGPLISSAIAAGEGIYAGVKDAKTAQKASGGALLPPPVTAPVPVVAAQNDITKPLLYLGGGLVLLKLFKVI